ncbi:four helix bundle protein [Carboxylicivirga caseinilyticus]|uniref:four helix bundle protein n=1 Tax=Carboxylicivirga caseinilyticus TaxID=3417572 RepID=UPI003D34915C|nr:four helix bundle protein [Marinilabiliaceae bacterium A049]
MRRSSRSICSNIAEAWAKKIYPKSFVNKISDSLGEEYETEVWLEYAWKCNYVTEAKYQKYIESYNEVRKILLAILSHPEKFSR